MNPRITNVLYETPYKLLLTFANKEVKEFDFSSYLQYPVYSPLKDEIYCRKAKVLNGTVVWDDSIDFDPDTLYLDGKVV
jgi:hypothetical protein